MVANDSIRELNVSTPWFYDTPYCSYGEAQNGYNKCKIIDVIIQS